MTRAIVVRKDAQNVIVAGGPRVITIKDAALISSLLAGAKEAATADPENAVTRIPIVAKALDTVINANATWVTGASTARAPYWNLPKQVGGVDVVSYVGFQLEVPSHWATAYFDLYIWNLASNAGNVSITVGVHAHTEGDSINTSPSGSNVVVAVPSTQWIDGKIRVGPITVDPTKRLTVRINRGATTGSDTLPNAIALYHLDVVKAS